MEMLREMARRLLCELFEQRLALRICRGARDSGLEPKHREESSRRIGGEFERQIDFAVAPGEARAYHANNFVVLVDQLDLLAHNVEITVVMTLPELIAQYGHILGILTIGSIRWQQSAPQEHRYAKIVEGIRGEIYTLDVFGKIAPGRTEVPSVHGGNALDRAGLPKLLQLRSVEVYKTAVAGRVVDDQVHHTV